MAKPLVSVIVPTYNRQDLILRAVQSALRQTYRELELFVVDDASTDATRDQLATIQDPRLRLLTHGANQGASAARNTGIAAAEGAFVAFLDSDDEWREQKLELQVAALQGQDGDLCYCQFSSTRADGTAVTGPREPYRGGSVLGYLASETGGLQTSSYVVRREFALPFDEATFPLDDWDWVIRVREKTDRFVFVPQPLCFFHTDAGERSFSSGPPLVQRTRPFLEKHAGELRDQPQARRRLGCWYAADALRRGQPALARHALRELGVYPSLWKRPKGIKLWAKALGW